MSNRGSIVHQALPLQRLQPDSRPTGSAALRGSGALPVAAARPDLTKSGEF
jgi:hypothetical protein